MFNKDFNPISADLTCLHEFEFEFVYSEINKYTQQYTTKDINN